MKIYTKVGDDGRTALYGSSDRISKANLRVAAYGDVDELNSVIGVVRSSLHDSGIDAVLESLQHSLFRVGAELACVPEKAASEAVPKVGEVDIAELERCIDTWETELTPLRNFILPGGSTVAAQLHLARTVCRRAERSVVVLHQQSPLRPELLCYLNRLSDLLFVLARLANQRASINDVPWRK